MVSCRALGDVRVLVRDLLPVLTALADWGAADLAGLRPTDALRAHWFALPLMRRLAELATPSGGFVNVRVDEGAFHILLSDAGPSYGHGPAEHPDAQLTLDSRACFASIAGRRHPAELIKAGQVRVDGDSSFAQALRSQ